MRKPQAKTKAIPSPLPQALFWLGVLSFLVLALPLR